MKHFFLLVGLLLAIRPAGAQAPRRAARPDSLTASLASLPAAPDTVAALHRQFAAKRKKLAFILLGTAAAELAGQVVIGATGHGGTGVLNERDVDHFFTALMAVPVVLAEVLFYVQYNKKHEARAVENFRLHHFPPYLRHQLKVKYFH